MLLFSTCLFIGIRMFWAQLGMETVLDERSELEAAFLKTWEVWEKAGGEAALAVKEFGKDWEIYDLPDDDWLPDISGKEETDAGNREVIFRKRLLDHGGVRSFWEVEFKSGQGKGKPGWRWYRKIYSESIRSPGKEDPD